MTAPTAVHWCRAHCEVLLVETVNARAPPFTRSRQAVFRHTICCVSHTVVRRRESGVRHERTSVIFSGQACFQLEEVFGDAKAHHLLVTRMIEWADPFCGPSADAGDVRQVLLAVVIWITITVGCDAAGLMEHRLPCRPLRGYGKYGRKEGAARRHAWGQALEADANGVECQVSEY